jgi:hypothetical protein
MHALSLPLGGSRRKHHWLQEDPQSQLPAPHEHDVKFGPPPPQRHRQLSRLAVHASPHCVSLACGHVPPLQLSTVTQVHSPPMQLQLPCRQPAVNIQADSLVQASPCASWLHQPLLPPLPDRPPLPDIPPFAVLPPTDGPPPLVSPPEPVESLVSSEQPRRSSNNRTA